MLTTALGVLKHVAQNLHNSKQNILNVTSKGDFVSVIILVFS